MKGIGYFYKTKWDGGQITIPRNVADVADFKNKDKILIELKDTFIYCRKL